MAVNCGSHYEWQLRQGQWISSDDLLSYGLKFANFALNDQRETKRLLFINLSVSFDSN